MRKPKLKTVTRTQGNNQALKDGIVSPKTFTFDFEEIPVLVHGFRRMVREQAYDISEMALTTYICAKEHGARFTALPIFLVRDFHHGALQYNINAGINHPKDLEGKKVGVNRGYTVTTGVWARSILQEEYGVDLSKITWVLSGDEHVAQYQPPENVVPVPPGKDMAEMLAAGELAAAIGIKVEDDNVTALIPNALDAGLNAVRERGVYPINHLIVVKDELLKAHPDLAVDIFNTFVASKQIYLEKLKAGRIENPTPIDSVHQQVLTTLDDPLPYGVEPNRQVLEQLIQHARTQNIIRKPVDVETLFVPSTLDLAG